MVKHACDIFAVAAKCGVKLRSVEQRYAGPLRARDCFCRRTLKRVGQQFGEGQAYDNTGKNIVSRDPYGNTAVTNKWGVTTVTNAGGRQVGSPQRGPLSATSAPGELFGNIGRNLPSAREVVGALLGGAIGLGIGGPSGAVAGARLGSRALGMENGPLGALFGRSFPDAPAMGLKDPRTSNRSERSMRDISPRAAEAISKGKGGLY